MLTHERIKIIACVLALVTAILAQFFAYSWAWFWLVVLAFIGMTAWGAFDLRLGYFTPVFYRKKHAKDRVVALTFDDGPTAYSSEILALLRQYNFKATFFCIGKQVQQHPDLLKQIVQEGHIVGNHSFSHTRKFGFLAKETLLEELAACDQAIWKVIQRKPKFFRPPFGVTNPSVAQAVKQSKYQVIGWSNRSLDGVMLEEDKIYNRVLNRLQSGDIILFHDTAAHTVRVLERLLPQMQKDGWTSVTVDKLLNLEAYET